MLEDYPVSNITVTDGSGVSSVSDSRNTTALSQVPLQFAVESEWESHYLLWVKQRLSLMQNNNPGSLYIAFQKKFEEITKKLIQKYKNIKINILKTIEHTKSHKFKRISDVFIWKSTLTTFIQKLFVYFTNNYTLHILLNVTFWKTEIEFSCKILLLVLFPTLKKKITA